MTSIVEKIISNTRGMNTTKEITSNSLYSGESVFFEKIPSAPWLSKELAQSGKRENSRQIIVKEVIPTGKNAISGFFTIFYNHSVILHLLSDEL